MTIKLNIHVLHVDEKMIQTGRNKCHPLLPLLNVHILQINCQIYQTDVGPL